MLHNGIYEQVINKALDRELATTDKLSQTAPIDAAEAAKVLAKYVAAVVGKGLENVQDNGGDVSSQVELVNHDHRGNIRGGLRRALCGGACGAASRASG